MLDNNEKGILMKEALGHQSANEHSGKGSWKMRQKVDGSEVRGFVCHTKVFESIMMTKSLKIFK